jgi:hypothetical protein
MRFLSMLKQKSKLINLRVPFLRVFKLKVKVNLSTFFSAALFQACSIESFHEKNG